MGKFSKVSQGRLNTCHPDLIRLFEEVVKTFDCVILCGVRNEVDQNKAFAEGNSEKKWPDSKHNSIPSLAVDVAPYDKIKKIDWTDVGRFYYFAGYVMGIASKLGIKVKSGCDWDMDTEIKDQTFNDLPHYEITN